MLDDNTKAHIKRELEQLERLLSDYGELIEKSRTIEPTMIERTALGAVLQSFYSGVENIFQTIAKRVDQKLPAGDSWHNELLHQMTQSLASRNPVISQSTLERLRPYLGFRHVARHAYTFVLEWNKMQKLVWDLNEVWSAVQADVNSITNNN